MCLPIPMEAVCVPNMILLLKANLFLVFSWNWNLKLNSELFDQSLRSVDPVHDSIFYIKSTSPFKPFLKSPHSSQLDFHEVTETTYCQKSYMAYGVKSRSSKGHFASALSCIIYNAKKWPKHSLIKIIVGAIEMYLCEVYFIIILHSTSAPISREFHQD